MLRTAIIALALAVLALIACSRVEGTGRSQILLYPDGEMNAMGVTAYAEVKKEGKPTTDQAAQAFVERVAKRLTAAAPDRGFQYEYTVLESKEMNAFCLPGGKIAVYTGILPLCENEAGLATVLGHEIAHAIANHGNERMSQGVMVGGVQTALAVVLQQKGVSDDKTALAMTAFGLGSQVGVMLPFSRKHESEADYLGLTYMAKAGYDPEEAVRFWQRFAKAAGSSGPAFLSTHPPSDQRAADLAARLDEAKRLYAAAQVHLGAGAPVPVLPPGH